MDLTEILRVLQVVLGIGLVIFVHEAGHFIAARICKVQVEVFSLGFGPPLFSKKHRGTIYQIAMVPLGGFVKMLGDEPTEEGRSYARDQELISGEGQVEVQEEVQEREKDEDIPQGSELSSKSVGQRFFIYSGGVLMNLAFAVVVFPILFAAGVPFTKPLVDPIPGGPAWQAGIVSGSRVDSIDGKRAFEFGHIPTAVALGDPNRIEMMVTAPGESTSKRYVLKPNRLESMGINVIDVRVGSEPGIPIRVNKDSPEWEAGLRPGMELVSVDGASTALLPIEQYLVRYRAGGEIVVNVRDNGELRTFRVQPGLSKETSSPRLGIRPPINTVMAIRENADVKALELREGDKLLSVSNQPIYRIGDFASGLVDSTDSLRFEVERDGQFLSLSWSESDGEMTPARRLALYSDIALAPNGDSTEIIVTEGEPGFEAGLRDGDLITHIDGVQIDKWDLIYDMLAAAGKRESAVELKIQRIRGDSPGYLELTVTPRTAPVPILSGMGLAHPEYIYQASSFMEAMTVGVECSIKFVEDTWLTLKRMIIGQVSPKNMGGVIMISQVSYSVSNQGLAKLFFFLCMLSINLAIINVLPIPVLDGGHLFFLLIEKLKGSPVSDRVLGYSQMVGLVLILSLMVYVTFNDIQRLFE
ncbi:MAG: regulator of sigma E protease [Planctomycetota bacterium]|jgi:regulator of sigma E protease